jgi:phosphopentomutase
MPRAILVVMDSVGCGGAPDAADFGDEGANTLGHIAEACAAGRAQEGRSGPLNMPVLDGLGLGAAVKLASGLTAEGLGRKPTGIWGAATEVSMGKDTPSGHWELSGVPVPWDWHYFPNSNPAFPPEIMEAASRFAGTDGTLANSHASGIPVIEKFGAEHMKTGWPICYTSVDSVFQIAAHEELFGLERLYDMCRGMATVLHPMRVGRVIARPFLGDAENGFHRTSNRKDFAMAPPAPTLLDRVQASGGECHAVGKIQDIFSGHGITRAYKGKGDADLFDHLVELTRIAPDNSLIFANFVEFDTLYGHQRDVSGYARALEWFDAQVPRVLAELQPDDLIFFTADHGNDPTWTGTDHTRERVPVVGRLEGRNGLNIGQIGFADVGETMAKHLGLAPGNHGKSFL